MAYKTLVFTAETAQELIAKDATNFDTITLKTVHITNNHTSQIDVDLFLDPTSGNDVYLLKNYALQAGASTVLEHDIQYDASANDLDITCTADTGTATFSVLLVYEILLKVNR
tara:strand:+ start:273 stop:611 length:339 start_codon:yes stop_codon:yes gene_type:complete